MTGGTVMTEPDPAAAVDPAAAALAGPESARRRARLGWRCRRGMRELDAVLVAFLEQGYGALDDGGKQLFEAMLNLPDPELYGYLLGRVEPEDPAVATLVAHMLANAAARRKPVPVAESPGRGGPKERL